VWSLLNRYAGNRGRGVMLSTAAYGIASVSAYIGGELVYTRGMGVNHQAWPEAPEDFTAVMEESSLPEGRLVRAKAGDIPVCLLRRGGTITAFEEWCTHLGGPLADGTLEDDTVTCPRHGSQFDVRSGVVLRGPATSSLRMFIVRVRNGLVEVRAADRGPALREPVFSR
jgi:nitrite reductase/ring-hydroxylating ferredoxin subunit